MAGISGLGSNSYVYSPTISFNSANTSPNNSDSASTDVSSILSQDDTLGSTGSDYTDQGVNLTLSNPSDSSGSDASQTTSSNSSKSDNGIYSAYNPIMDNYFRGLNMMVGTSSGDSTTDSVTALSTQLNLLNQGIDVSKIPGVSGTQTSGSSNLVQLGNELNQLNNGININDDVTQQSDSTSDSASAKPVYGGASAKSAGLQQPDAATSYGSADFSEPHVGTSFDSTQNADLSNILNYNYSPSSGISTNPNTASGAGSLLDVQV